MEVAASENIPEKAIEFLDAQNQQPRTEFNWINPLVKGIPSVIVPIYVKNNLEDRAFVGRVLVSPSESQSYSEDAYLAYLDVEGRDVWSRTLEMTVKPGERVGIKVRIAATTTPENSRGTANLSYRGRWEVVADPDNET